MTDGRIKAIGLIRVSTAAQADEHHAGVPAQREAIRKLAQQYGLDVVKTFELIDVSGARIMEDPQYREFMAMLQWPEIQAAVSKEMSRFMRPERLEDQRIIDWFGDFGITLYLPDGPMDCTNRQTRFFASIRLGIAGLERQEIRDRVMSGKEALRRQGKHPSAPHTLARGIRYDRKQGWHYDEEELTSVRLLFREFLKGNHNYHHLSELTGIPRSTVPIILENPVYAGRMTYRTKHDLSPAGAYPARGSNRPARRKIPRRPDEIIEVRTLLEPIVSESEHAYIVSVVRDLRTRRYAVRLEGQHHFTYRGFLYCGACRQPVYTHVSGVGKEFYHCKSRQPRYRGTLAFLKCTNRYMSRHLLEPKLNEALFRYLSDRKFLADRIEQYLALQKPTSSATIEVQVKTLQAKRERITDAFVVERLYTREQYQSRIAAIDTQLRKLQAISTVEAIQPERLIEAVQVFREWHLLSMAQRRRLLEAHVPEIFVHQYEVGGLTLQLSDGDRDSLWKKVSEVTILASPRLHKIYIPLSESTSHEAQV